MFDKLKDWTLRRAIRKQAPRQVLFQNYQDIKTVLIVYESDVTEQNAIIKRLRDDLIKDGKDVALLGYADKKEIVSLVLPKSRIIGKKNLSFFDKPSEEVIQYMQQSHYDLLLDLTMRPCRPLHYLALYARADFKAGLDMTKGILDFMISTSEQNSPVFLFEQIIRYLKMINSK